MRSYHFYFFFDLDSLMQAFDDPDPANPNTATQQARTPHLTAADTLDEHYHISSSSDIGSDARSADFDADLGALSPFLHSVSVHSLDQELLWERCM